jgi:hypothetical protein
MYSSKKKRFCLILLPMGAAAGIPASIEEDERMRIARIKLFENKPLNPGILESLAPFLQLNWRRTNYICYLISEMVLNRRQM